MVALFIDNCNDTSIRISDFARHLDCSTTRVIRLMSGIDELERRGLVCCCRERSGITCRVPWDVVEAFKRNEKYAPRDYSGLSCAELFSVIEEIMCMRDENELSTDGYNETTTAFGEQQTSDICPKVPSTAYFTATTVSRSKR